MRMRNFPVAIVVAAIVGTFPVIEALAQPPSNDSRAGAVVVTSVPFSYAEDTSEATASGPKFCSNNGSVFFKLHAASDQDLQVDTIGSGYDTVASRSSRTPRERSTRSAATMTPSGSPRPCGSTRTRGPPTSLWWGSAAATARVEEEGTSRSRSPRPRRRRSSYGRSVGAHGTVDADGIATIRGRVEVLARGVVSSVEPCGSDGDIYSSLAVRSSPRWRVIRDHRRLGTQTQTRRQVWCSVLAPPGCSRLRSYLNGFESADQGLRQRSVEIMEP